MTFQHQERTRRKIRARLLLLKTEPCLQVSPAALAGNDSFIREADSGCGDARTKGVVHPNRFNPVPRWRAGE
jgi:hypothetical protein